MSDRDQIYAVVSTERAAQDARFGNQVHTMPIWSTILSEECGEVAEASLRVQFYGDGELAHLREELIQVAAVAVHIVEKIDSGNWVRGNQ